MLDPRFSRLAVAGSVLLIALLAYASQLLLLQLSRRQSIFFNALVACIWTSYYRSIATHPGSPPRDWAPPPPAADAEEGRGRPGERRLVVGAGKWCRKCVGYRPVRAHHCRTCKVCVLRMDHHCPWTNNCVGYRNLPHFLRFLAYSAFTSLYLLTHLFSLCAAVWDARNTPAHSSPHTLPQLLLLAALTPTTLFTTLALSILSLRSLWSAANGYTTIETWEQDRHDALVARRKVPRQEFPYDIGFWDNLCSAFGATGNVLAWCWPLARTCAVGEALRGSSADVVLAGGLEWEVNGYEDVGLLWPPVDPDRLAAAGFGKPPVATVAEGEVGDEWVEGVRRRQREDMDRRRARGETGARQEELRYPRIAERGGGGGGGWRNDEGESLADFGVEEEDEAEEGEGDDEDVPLAVLMGRKMK
ncbi:DHHC palmitoyltransferase-domain-containing protein [Morchella snyderi]|nr:DHHC palmitoyltransferase-domain-containing protein [Morchella snyderi]